VNRNNSIFQNDWWLEAVAPGQWRHIELTNGGETVAAMPIVETRRYGLRTVGMPRLTHSLGPWFDLGDVRNPKKHARQNEILNGLIDQLPEFDYFVQTFHHTIDNALPFHWRGFDLRVIYTYVLEDLTDPDVLWNNYLGSVRTEVRKGRQNVEVKTDLPLSELWRLIQIAFDRSDRATPYSFELLERVEKACRERNACETFYAVDAKGQTHAAVFVVWDENAAYYLASGADPALRSSGATSLLMHEAILHVSKYTKTFDFHGIMHKPYEYFKRNFGGEMKRQVQVVGHSRRMRLLRDAASATRFFRIRQG